MDTWPGDAHHADMDAMTISMVVAVFVLGAIIFAVYLSRVRVYEDGAEAQAAGRITPLVVEFVHRRRIAEVLLDLCLAAIAYYTAYRLRFGTKDFQFYFPQFLQSLPLVMGVQLLSLFTTGAYRGVWQYFGLMDGVTFARGGGAQGRGIGAHMRLRQAKRAQHLTPSERRQPALLLGVIAVAHQNRIHRAIGHTDRRAGAAIPGSDFLQHQGQGQVIQSGPAQGLWHADAVGPQRRQALMGFMRKVMVLVPLGGVGPQLALGKVTHRIADRAKQSALVLVILVVIHVNPLSSRTRCFPSCRSASPSSSWRRAISSL